LVLCRVFLLRLVPIFFRRSSSPPVLNPLPSVFDISVFLVDKIRTPWGVPFFVPAFFLVRCCFYVGSACSPFFPVFLHRLVGPAFPFQSTPRTYLGALVCDFLRGTVSREAHVYKLGKEYPYRALSPLPLLQHAVLFTPGPPLPAKIVITGSDPRRLH